MTITIDDQPFSAADHGLSTVGQILAHLSAKNRLVVHLLIDGREPDLARPESFRTQSLRGHSVYIETTEPKKIADEVFDEIQRLLDSAETLRTQAIDHLQAGQHAEALKKLGTCFTSWNHTRESVEKVARLLRVDLDQIELGDATLSGWLEQFTAQLSSIRAALEARDFVQLSDILAYEADKTATQWRDAMSKIRAVAM